MHRQLVRRRASERRADVLFLDESLSEFACLSDILDENGLLSTSRRSEYLDELLESLLEDVGRSHVDLRT